MDFVAGVHVAGTSDPNYYCIWVQLDGINRTGGLCGGSGHGNSASGQFECNLIGAHTVSAYATGNDPLPPHNPLPPLDLGSKTVVVSGPPPAFCNLLPNDVIFDITDKTPPDDRRVLLSNTHVDAAGTPVYPYPHYQNLLARDRAILVNLRTTVNYAPTSGIQVTLRVIDPADPSPYVAGGTGITQPVPGSGSRYSRAGDNAGDPATLAGNGITDNGNGTYAAVSGENGFVGAELHLPELAPSTPQNPNPTYNPAKPGDNYQVEATATFPDGTTKTVRSGVITVWKRMFVEKKQMFKRGIELATNAPTGVKHIVIPNRHLTPGGASSDDIKRNDHIMLLHAPSYGQPKTPAAYYRVIYQVTANPKVFTASAPTAGNGTLTTDSASTTIVGVGTRFTHQLKVENVINIRYASGDTDWRVVLAISDNTHVRVNAPPSASGSGVAYTIGDPNLAAGTSYIQLTLDRALGENYQIEPGTRARLNPTDPPIPVPTLNDAVAKLGGASVTPDDVFDFAGDSALVGTTPPNPFPAAYTEYVVLPPQPALNVPTPHAVFSNTAPDAQFFVNKWFDLPSPALMQGGDPTVLDQYFYFVRWNHQLLLVGDSEATRSDAGQTFRVGNTLGQRCSILDRGQVEHDVADTGRALYGLNVDAVIRRVEVHEVAHQYDVNGAGTAGHCEEVGYASSQGYPSATPPAAPPPGTQFCLMAVDRTLTMPAPWNASLLISTTVRADGDADTTFHMSQGANGTWDSEYFTIRKAADPWRP